MSLPDQMTDRWPNRPEPPPGEGAVSWHMLMRDYPEVVDLARRAQRRLAAFDGLHVTPLRWLHVTTLLVGPAADFAPDKLRQMTQTAAGLLADTPPLAVTLGQALYHPEAIMLAVTPVNAGPDQSYWTFRSFPGRCAHSRHPAENPSTGSDHCSSSNADLAGGERLGFGYAGDVGSA